MYKNSYRPLLGDCQKGKFEFQNSSMNYKYLFLELLSHHATGGLSAEIFLPQKNETKAGFILYYILVCF